MCVFYNRSGETLLHLLIQCPLAVEVWKLVCMWTGIDFFQSDSIVDHLLLFNVSVGGRVLAKKRLLLWLVYCWTIWCKSHLAIFKNEVVVTVEVFEQIRLSSWYLQIIGVKAKGSYNYFVSKSFGFHASVKVLFSKRTSTLVLC